MTAVYGNDEGKVKANRALRSLKNLLAKGNRKISRLNKEQLLAAKQKKAEKNQEEKKVAEAKAEIKRQKSKIAAGNYSMVSEGRSDEAYIKGYKYYRQLKESYEGAGVSAGYLSLASDSMGTVAGNNVSGSEISVSDVTITGTIDF